MFLYALEMDIAITIESNNTNCLRSLACCFYTKVGKVTSIPT